MRLKKQLKQIPQSKDLTWLNFEQLEKWTKEWIKNNNKCKEYTKYEQFLLTNEDIQKDDSVKGVVSKTYNIILDLEENETEGEGLKQVWKQDFKKNKRNKKIGK